MLKTYSLPLNHSFSIITSMTIEKSERSYFDVSGKHIKTQELRTGDQVPDLILGKIEVISDDEIKVKGNKFLLLGGRTLTREEIDLRDSWHWFPPRTVSIKWKPSEKINP